ncbi:MAG: M18 family aminopeptidase [Methylovulum sp.]|nr:M18 family aminopeptidase [Methylovulum sp.]
MNSPSSIQHLLDFIDASPSPWHAVQSVEQQLAAYRFVRLDETANWSLRPGGRYYVIRDGSAIIAFVAGQQALADTGFKIIGAHTDSPGLRIKPNAASYLDGHLRLGVEVYGGPILATFADRDLSLAGRISHKNELGQVESRLIQFDQALLRLPNLAIHMNRSVNDDGLKLHKQNELPLILARCTEDQLPQPYFLSLLQQQSGLPLTQILSWDLNVYDTQKGVVWGAENEFYADSQLDNLASCHAAITALLDDAVLEARSTLVCALFDHEEVGSESSKGADGGFLPDILQRIALATATGPQDYARALAQSMLVSADMAHAYQPNFPLAYDPDHKVLINKGPVIKINAGQRYSTESHSAALFAGWCEEAGVPYQKYSHRCDLPCGSTIGPITAAKLGIRSVDVGNPMWAMHSIRESAGVLDHAYMISVMTRFFTG